MCVCVCVGGGGGNRGGEAGTRKVTGEPMPDYASGSCLSVKFMLIYFVTLM